MFSPLENVWFITTANNILPFLTLSFVHYTSPLVKATDTLLRMFIAMVKVLSNMSGSVSTLKVRLVFCFELGLMR